MTTERPIETIGEAYSRLAQGYDAHYADPVSEAENRLVFGFLEQALPDGRTIDLGCRTALALDHLSIAPDKYLGVDLSTGMLAIARQKHPHHEFVKADMAHLPCEAASFDAAISLFGPSSYCLSLVAVKEEVYRVLRPGGVYFLMLYGFNHKRKGAACVIEEGQVEGVMRSHCSAQYVRANFPGALVFGMTTGDGYTATGPITEGTFIARNLIRGLIRPEDSFYLVVCGAKELSKDTGTLKFTCATWRRDAQTVSPKG